MRQETVALQKRLAKLKAERATYKMALDCEEAIDLIEEVLELRDAVCDMDEKIQGLEAFVKARNEGMLAPNPPRVVTLGNPWADDPDPGCEKGPRK